MSTTVYPFDPTGTNPLNRITGEVHVITPTNDRHFNFFVPENGPFFADSVSFVFRHPDNSIWNMVEGVDFYFTHKFLSASKACAKELFGSITFLNNQVRGVVTMNYNTIGGTWTAVPNQVAEVVADMQNNPRITTWEQVVDLPFQFPVVDHEWDLADMVGMSDLINSIESIYDLMFASSDSGLTAHLQNTSNPHNVTKSQLGLSLVQNFGIATSAQVQAGAGNAYITPSLLREGVLFHGNALVDAHAARADNPHSTTKAHVGLSNVDNYATATSAIAVTGDSTTNFMTPKVTKDAFTSFNTANAAHIANTSNPHNTTKSHVGLGNVENFGIASLQQAQQGIATNAYMTASTTSAAISFQALLPLNAHVNNTDNPHGTTKTQIGLSQVMNLPLATSEQAIEMSSNDAYMTPLRTRQLVEAMGVGVGSIEAHATDDQNPHNTTADQVGAYTIAETDSAIAVVDAAISTHSALTNNPHNATAAQVGAYTTGEIDSIVTTVVSSVSLHTDRTDNPHSTTAAQVGAYTTGQVDAIVDALPINSGIISAGTGGPLINTYAGKVYQVAGGAVTLPSGTTLGLGKTATIFNESSSSTTLVSTTGGLVNLLNPNTGNNCTCQIAPRSSAILTRVSSDYLTLNGPGVTYTDI